MDGLALVLITVSLMNVALGAVVLRAGANKRVNRVFGAVALMVALWSLANAGFRLAATEESAALWAMFAYGPAVGLGATYLHFSWIYPERRHPVARGREIWTVWIVAMLIAVLAFVPGAMVERIAMAPRSIQAGLGLYLVAAFMLGTSLPAFRGFYLNQQRLRGRRQAQARYVLFGSALTGASGLFFNLFLPLLGNYNWVWAGPASSLFFVGFSVYSIVTHHLFDVRILVRHTVAYSVVLAVLAGGFAALEKGLEHVVRPLLGHDDAFPTELLAALVVGFGTEPVQRWAKSLVRQWLFRGESDEDGD